MSSVAYIALGCNLGDRHATLARARDAIGSVKSLRVLRATEAEETDPIGPIRQGKFLNQMLAVSTDLSPRALLSALQRIERAEGRVRNVRWGPRTLDLDIVVIDGVEYSDDALTVPHPELPNRDFWARELDELRGVSDG